MTAPTNSVDARIRRCAHLVVEPRESLSLDVAGLFGGGEALSARIQWLARCAHLDSEVPLEAADLALLGEIGESLWQSRAALEATHGRDRITRLLDAGVLVERGSDADRRDEAVRATPWERLAAVLHAQTRWRARQDAADEAPPDLAAIVARFGEPPSIEVPPDRDGDVALQPVHAACVVELLRRRVTCRNFDTSRTLPSPHLATMLDGVFGYLALDEAQAGLPLAKRTSPSAGSLHPVDAWVLVRDCAEAEPGLYRYQPGRRVLHLQRALSKPDAHAAALRFAAGQAWFADAHVQVALVARFARTYWKYRAHPKAYRAMVLDAGHLSQTAYALATELGLGAFVTAACNEVDIEHAFGLDAGAHSPIALCGFGLRADRRAHVEFDPEGRVWDGERRRG